MTDDAGVDVEPGVAYRGTPAGDLHLDLYRPADGDRATDAGGQTPAAPHPAVVFLHGGAWRSGEKGQFERQARGLARRGYACLAVNYRLSGTATYPAAVRDVRAAVRWARADPDGVGLDGRVAAVGQSAGAHLAALVALAPADDERAADGTVGGESPSSTPDAVVGVSGIYDLEPFRHEGPYCEEFLGATFEEEPELYRGASPITHVPGDGSDADSDADSVPPVLLCYATDDDLVRNDQSGQFRAALADAGVPVETFVADSGGHRFFREDGWADETAERMGDFLDEYLADG